MDHPLTRGLSKLATVDEDEVSTLGDVFIVRAANAEQGAIDTHDTLGQSGVVLVHRIVTLNVVFVNDDQAEQDALITISRNVGTVKDDKAKVKLTAREGIAILVLADEHKVVVLDVAA